MAKASVDPAELKRFAKDLSRFNHDVQALMSSLHARMLHLEKTWRDQEQRKFAEEFELTLKTLSRFVQTSEEHVGFLMRKAAHVEEYLQQR
jgi:uncharacterized protein YukE